MFVNRYSCMGTVSSLALILALKIGLVVFCDVDFSRFLQLVFKNIVSFFP